MAFTEDTPTPTMTDAGTAEDPANVGEAPKPVEAEAVEKLFKQRIESSKRVRRNLYPEWKRNVELRIGKVATQFTGGVRVEDDIQAEINPDWSLTKTKTANLYSQVPTVQLTHENRQYAAAIPPFAKALNYELGEKRMNIGAAMEEVLNDVVNAAGVGAIVVGYAARFEDVEVPAVDVSHIPPQMVQQAIAAKLIPMTRVPRVVSDKFFGTRVSPVDLLWPAEFTGSCFDDGDWIGRSGRTSWAEAVHEFKLREEDKDKVINNGDVPKEDDLRSEPDRSAILEKKVVKYDELYYWRYRVDPDCKSFSEIWKLVYVEGLDKPAIHEKWTGQKYDEQSHKYVGACKFPIRVLTVTYITDNPIPPSDSSAGRPQVNDMRRSRSQMFQNRERSIPIRWYDVNRIDPEIQDTLMRGTWQGMIPTNGDGSRAIGEIARASYPAEDMAFDDRVKGDLMESWQIGPNQQGMTPPGKRTKDEVNVVQQSFATRIGQERNRVASFFLSIVEVAAGLMALYSDFPILTEEERQGMQKAWDSKHVLHDLVFKIRPDSTIVLDPNQRLQKIFQFINMTAKSGYVNVKPLLVEAAELSGIDPSEVIVDPQPKKPEDPNMSFRFSSKDDIINATVMALLVKSGQAPSAEDIEAAKKLLMTSVMPPAPPQPPAGPGAEPGSAGAGAPPGPHPPGPGAAPGSGGPANAAHPDWSLASKVAKRSRDMSAGA